MDGVSVGEYGWCECGGVWMVRVWGEGEYVPDGCS